MSLAASTAATAGEFESNCTLLILRSRHHYPPPSSSLHVAASSIVAAAASAANNSSGGPVANGLSIASSMVAAAAASVAAGQAAVAASVGSVSASNAPLQQTPNVQDLQQRLENKNVAVKVQAMKELLLWSMAPVEGSGGGTLLASRLLLTVIKFVLPCQHHQVVRLLQLYWEIVDKAKPDGTLKEEMILVCNKLREDLLHSNEYIRGTTLRLLCKIRFAKLIAPLQSSVMENLDHHHSYVRRNAVMCIHSLVRSFGIGMVPNAVEEMERILLEESDLSTRRNAFLVLSYCDPERAVSYLSTIQENICGMSDIFHLAILELLRKVSLEKLSLRNDMVHLVAHLLQSASPAVVYEAATAFVSFSSDLAPALRAAARAFVGLLAWQTENTVKSVVLDLLQELSLRPGALAMMEEFAVEILRALPASSFHVRTKCIDLVLRLTGPRNRATVLAVLKKELQSLETDDEDADYARQSPQQPLQAGTVATSAVVPMMTAPSAGGNKSASTQQQQQYEQLLVRALRHACQDDRTSANTLLPVLVNLLTTKRPTTAAEAAAFLRSLVAQCLPLRAPILKRLIPVLNARWPASRIARTVLWILGEYAAPSESSPTDASYDAELRRDILAALCGCVDPLPLTTTAAQYGGQMTSAPFLTEVDLINPLASEDQTFSKPALVRDMLVAAPLQSGTGAQQQPDFLLASQLAVSIAKVACRAGDFPDNEKLRVRSTLVVSSLLRFCLDDHPKCGGPQDHCAIRISHALRAMLNPTSFARPLPDLFCSPQESQRWLGETRDAVEETLSVETASLWQSSNAEIASPILPFLQPPTTSSECSTAASGEDTEFDTALTFRQFGGGSGMLEKGGGIKIASPEQDLQLALGQRGPHEDSNRFQQRLARVKQMTGLNDPIYVEAFLLVNSFDLIVELLIINRTDQTLQNVLVELATQGDLKLVQGSPPVVLPPQSSQIVHASIKVQSTETGIIFGNITWDGRPGAMQQFLVLSETQVNLLDFVQPNRWISEASFRQMWADFEWENKLTVSPLAVTPEVFLDTLMRDTGMTIVGCYDGFSNMCTKDAAASMAVCSPLSKLQTNSWRANIGGPDFSNLSTPASLTLQKLPDLQRLLHKSSLLAVNLYCRSVFGEHVLANVSLERTAAAAPATPDPTLPNASEDRSDGGALKLAGNIRIRSRSQGTALSFGDRVSAVQRKLLQQQQPL